MTISRRGLLGGALAGVGAGVLSACAPTPSSTPTPGASLSSSAAARTSLTIGMTYIPNIQFSPLYVARDQGIFADHGLDVTLRHHGQQEDAFGAVTAGQEDVVLASSDEAVVAAANGSSLATFATCYQRFPAEVMTTLPLPEQPLDVLKGIKLGIPGHFGSNYYAALCALHLSGLTEQEVTLTDVGYTQVTALTTGNVEAIVGYRNNELVQFQAQGIEVSTVPVSDPAAPSLVGPGLVTVRDRLSVDVLRAVRDAVLAAEIAIAENPALAMEATEKEVPTLSEPEQRAAAEAVLAETIELWKGDQDTPHAEIDEAAFERMGQLLTDVGIIDAPPSNTLLSL
ncbi:ABC transporter substrate-binding protein [Tessaracoccus caeni]|uniref:ABC transporter substrate-binding protein n=1 Tax=Tessaracoccus caeni TaxID=3031239 RepID=UPI0023D99F3C|nr:ABC transporter substrate-binding protein [Tessaracoccus caeni]MDF1486906.1 ABC transporter substrate-binding protein [Tessaracoccus caeni]